MSYDAEFWLILNEAGWKEVRPTPDHGRVFVRAQRDRIELNRISDTLRTHPWCDGAMRRAFEKGAVGWTITEYNEEGGALTLRFIPEWPDAVSALAFVSADLEAP